MDLRDGLGRLRESTLRSADPNFVYRRSTGPVPLLTDRTLPPRSPTARVSGRVDIRTERVSSVYAQTSV